MNATLRKELIKQYMEKACLTSVEQAENQNHHTIVAMSELDSCLSALENGADFTYYSGRRIADKRYLINKFEVCVDLCRNDYDLFIDKLSETSRQILLRERT